MVPEIGPGAARNVHHRGLLPWSLRAAITRTGLWALPRVLLYAASMPEAPQDVWPKKQKKKIVTKIIKS